MYLLLPLVVGVMRAFLVIVGGLIRVCPERLMPLSPWPFPAGPHSVGRRDLVLLSTPSLAARIWYPSEAAAEARASLFTESDLRAMSAGESFLPSSALERFGRTVTASSDDAPHKQILSKSPLVVFSHGLGGYVAQNTILAETLSSFGFIVVSIAHPGGAAAIAWPDGTVDVMSSTQRRDLLRNSALMRSMRDVRRATSVQALRDALLHHARIEPMASECQRWAANVSAAITALATDPQLADHIDFDRIAAVGMSFGGAASALAARQDARIKAVANLDGGQFGEQLFEKELPVPILVLQSQGARLIGGHAWNDFFYQSPGRPPAHAVKRYWALNAGHLDFTDLTLLQQPLIRHLFGLRVADGKAMASDLAAAVTRFLRAVLIDREADASMDGGSTLTLHTPRTNTDS